MEELRKGLIKGIIGEFDFLESNRGEITSLKSENLSSENASISELESNSITSASVNSESIDSKEISSESITADTISVGEILLNGKDITDSLEVKEIIINGTPFDPTNIKSFTLSDNRSNPKSYDIVENGIFPTENENEYIMRSNYIPDASFYWKENYHHFVDNHIVKIVDKVCYNENDEPVCFIDTSKIVKCGFAIGPGYAGEWGNSLFFHCFNNGDEYHGPRIAEVNSYLVSIDSDFDSLVTGDYMFCWPLMADTSDSEYNRPEMTSFKGSLSNLVSGNHMFGRNWAMESFSSNLNSLVNGEGMFYDCHNLESFDLNAESIPTDQKPGTTLDRSSSLNNLVNGASMFESCNKLYRVQSDFYGLKNGYKMFYGCQSLVYLGNFYGVENGDYMLGACHSLKMELSKPFASLYSANHMFEDCYNLESFLSSLPELQYGNYMFADCYWKEGTTTYGLKKFDSDMPNLISANNMFEGCKLLTEFKNDVSSLKNADGMFLNCEKLERFVGSTFELTDAISMFEGCSSLSTFIGDLSNLHNATNMFSGCILNAESLDYILSTIGTSEFDGTITIGLGCIETEKDTFVQEIGYENMEAVDLHLRNLGWNAVFEYNG